MPGVGHWFEVEVFAPWVVLAIRLCCRHKLDVKYLMASRSCLASSCLSSFGKVFIPWVTWESDGLKPSFHGLYMGVGHQFEVFVPWVVHCKWDNQHLGRRTPLIWLCIKMRPGQIGN